MKTPQFKIYDKVERDYAFTGTWDECEAWLADKPDYFLYEIQPGAA